MILAGLFVMSVILLYALQYRIELVFKHRNLAFHNLRKAALNNQDSIKVLLRYYDLYKIEKQLIALNKWTYEDMFPDFEQKLSRVTAKRS